MAIKNQSQEKLGVGIVGLGHVAEHQVAALRLSDDFALLAACDHDSGARATLAAAIDTYESLDEMLERSDLDVVIVATPNRLHVEHGIRVMEAGKRLLVEKPVAETQADFDSFAEKKRSLAGRCSVALHAAFGVEVEWFVTQLANGKFDELEFDSFRCQFYDPYIENDQLQAGAMSLGGSWIDSGINALSVVCRLFESGSLAMTDSRMSRHAEFACLEIKGTVDFHVSDQKLSGPGMIETDWTRGQNKKVTTLGVAGGSREIILDHSEQTVLLVDGSNEQLIFECGNDLPRLTNHYVGVFSDLARQIQSEEDNLDYCRTLHEFLYQAETWSD